MNFLNKYKYTEAEIPQEDMVFVNLLRKFLGDDETLNRLEEVKENTDLELYHALIMAAEQINTEFLPITNKVEFDQFPAWSMLALGATLNVLTSKGILSARNTLTYRDSGGITVQDYDKYGRYINYFNILVNKFYNAVRTWKSASNIDAAYGGEGPGSEAQASEYTWLWD